MGNQNTGDNNDREERLEEITARIISYG